MDLINLNNGLFRESIPYSKYRFDGFRKRYETLGMSVTSDLDLRCMTGKNSNTVEPRLSEL